MLCLLCSSNTRMTAGPVPCIPSKAETSLEQFIKLPGSWQRNIMGGNSQWLSLGEATIRSRPTPGSLNGVSLPAKGIAYAPSGRLPPGAQAQQP